MSLAEAPNRWVARHSADCAGVVSDERNSRAEPRSRSSRFAARVSPTDDDHVHFRTGLFHVKHRSLPNAKSREKPVENVLDIDAAGDLAKASQSQADVLGAQFDARRFEGVRSSVQRCPSSFQSPAVARTRDQGISVSERRPCALRDATEKLVHASARLRRYAHRGARRNRVCIEVELRTHPKHRGCSEIMRLASGAGSFEPEDEI